MSEAKNYVESISNQSEELKTKLDYADINKSLEENMQNLLKNSQNTEAVKQYEYQSSIQDYWDNIGKIIHQCESSNSFNEWFVNILDTYLNKQSKVS